jgi:glycosyltransferase involved in cell wall biosynthesis
MPIVSVIIPSYNHANYIAKAVQSVLNQMLGDLELIVVDDGSSDQSMQVLSTFSDPRLKIYSQSNQGAHAAINRGLELATGEYLTILNSDDMYYPQRLEKLVGTLKKYPGVGMIGSYIHVIDQVGNSLGIKHGYHDLSPWVLPHPEKSFRNGADLKLVLLTENYWATTSNYLFRQSCFKQVGSFRPLRYAHDWDFALRMAGITELLMVPEPLLYYRVHQTNTIRENRSALIYENCWILAFHLPHFLHQPWFENQDADFHYNQLLHSIYVNQCERVLSFFLLQDIAHRPEFALELLNTNHPMRSNCLDFINAQLLEAENCTQNSSSRSSNNPKTRKKILELFRSKS